MLCPGPTSHTLKQSETYLTKSNASLQFYIQLQVIFSHIFSQRKVFSQKVWQQECQTFLKNIFQELFIQLTSPELLKTISRWFCLLSYHCVSLQSSCRHIMIFIMWKKITWKVFLLLLMWISPGGVGGLVLLAVSERAQINFLTSNDNVK